MMILLSKITMIQKNKIKVSFLNNKTNKHKIIHPKVKLKNNC